MGVLCVCDHADDVPNVYYCRIFLIDHAWTYRPDQARAHLQSMPSLLSRMAALMNVDVNNRQRDDIIEDVLMLMWRCVLTVYAYCT